MLLEQVVHEVYVEEQYRFVREFKSYIYGVNFQLHQSGRGLLSNLEKGKAKEKEEKKDWANKQKERKFTPVSKVALVALAKKWAAKYLENNKEEFYYGECKPFARKLSEIAEF